MKFSKDKIAAFIQRRLHIQNQNAVLLISGGNGSGKSMAAIAIAREVDRDFNIDNICFSAEEYFTLLDSGKLKRGSAVVLDELGVWADNRVFMSPLNRLLAQTSQTIRHRNLCTIATVPSLGWIDKKIRNLVQLYVEMMGVNLTINKSVGKIFRLQTNFRTGDVYFHSIKDRSGLIPYKIRTIRFVMPPASIVEQYERKKTAFTTALFREGKKVASAKERVVQPRQSYQDIISYIQSNRDEFTLKNKISMGKVAGKYGFGGDKTKHLKNILKSQGEKVIS